MMNNRIAVVLGCNIHWAPYYYRYEKLLLQNKVDFDVIMWNREGRKEKIKGNLLEFSVPDTSNDHNPRKVGKFFSYANFVRKMIKNGNYSKVVFLGLQGCALTLNAGFFSHQYKRQYWVDIRDYHYEWFKPYYMLEKLAIDNSFYAVISSSGFEEFLPPHKYGKIHNIDPMMEDIVSKYSPIKSEKIRISFIGNVRYYDENVRIIDRLGNDDRFVLQYFGPGGEQLGAYCKDHGIYNVHFEGAFDQDKTRELYEKTDIINNVYGNRLVETKTALSNKLYYSLYLELPILVSPNTYMEKISKDKSFSISFQDTVDFADKLYLWYENFQRNKPVRGFETLRAEIEENEHNWIDKFQGFILEEGWKSSGLYR